MSTWNLPPPPGFQGLRDDLPLDVYVRHMPHWRQNGATYFVTFRLADSLPQEKLHELKELRRVWELRHPAPHDRAALEELARQSAQRTEDWLDQGLGSCVLKEPACAAFISQAMHHFDGDRYELDAYVVMPNHVHAILRPTQCQAHPLETLLKSWKQYSSKSTNAHLRTVGRASQPVANQSTVGRVSQPVENEPTSQPVDNEPASQPVATKPVLPSGQLWQEESYDRIIRDEEHLDNCLQYIGANPRKAGLPPNACPLWIRPEWAALGWTFRH